MIYCNTLSEDSDIKSHFHYEHLGVGMDHPTTNMTTMVSFISQNNRFREWGVFYR